jgi:glycine betaine/proline transport system substrate-binding protein
MKKMVTGVAAAVALTFGANAALADGHACGDVSITEMDWASSAVVTAVSKFLMEQGYGCNVQIVPSSTVPALTSLAETGEPDILTEVWANSTPSYEPLLADGKLVELANVLSDGGVEAWWIPAYLAESNPELTTWEGIMANPAAVGGKFHDCPSGWACDIINNNNLKALNIDGTGLERFQHGSGEHFRRPSRRPMAIKHHGWAITGHQQLFWASTQWFRLKLASTTQKRTHVTATLIARIQSTLLILRQKL